MSSGGGSKVEYSQSPEQRQIMGAVMPLFQGLSEYGQSRYFGGAPQMGAPSMSGVLTGQPMYDIPDPSMAMPTANWFGSLSPEVKAGLYAPYMEAGQGIAEMMGARGQMGSGSSGHTGAFGAAMGELAGQAARDVGLNAWQMTAPAAQAGWNANLMRNQQAYGAGQQERLGNYNTAMNVWGMPMQTLNYMGQGMPQAYAQPQSNPMGGMFSGGLMGGLAGGSMFGFPGAMIGGGLGGLAGLFS
jgi:predicted lipid-binding transport protein (Tim44 family)